MLEPMTSNAPNLKASKAVADGRYLRRLVVSGGFIWLKARKFGGIAG